MVTKETKQKKDPETVQEKPDETQGAEETGRSVSAPEDIEKRKREIYAITPRGLEHVADECVLLGLNVEESRAKLKKALEESMEPVGTQHTEDPAAAASAGEGTAQDAKPKTREEQKEETKRAIFK